MTDDKIVASGHYVKLHYTGTFDDGSVFDSSEGKDPLEVLAGKGMLIKGFDSELVGMKVGEEKEFDVDSDDAYGEPRDDLVKEIPKKDLGKDITPEIGMTLGVKAPNGQVFPAVVKEVKDDSILLDANHPLAGKDLHFKVKVEEARVPTAEDMQKFAPQSACSSCSSGSCDQC
ncbi:MAG: FKBP-type peptidyl-prolyl cis-trans isomerase [Nanoarchaeota archaeon]